MEPKQIPLEDSRKKVCTYKLVTRETKRGVFCFHGNRNWIGCAVGAVCIFSILTNIVLLVVYTGLSKEADRQKHVLDKINAKLLHYDSLVSGSDKSWPGSDVDQLLHNRHGHHDGHRDHRWKKTHRGRRHLDDGPRPVTQLRGVGIDNGPIFNGEYLLWRKPRPGTFRNSFDYEYSGNDRVKGIEVKKSGIYRVFAKISLNGKTIQNTGVSECGHELVRIHGSNRPQTQLLQGSVMTQDREGRFYPRSERDGRAYPLDSLSVEGYFHLFLGDKLRVRISEYCQRYARISMNENTTQFSASLFNELYS